MYETNLLAVIKEKYLNGNLHFNFHKNKGFSGNILRKYLHRNSHFSYEYLLYKNILFFENIIRSNKNTILKKRNRFTNRWVDGKLSVLSYEHDIWIMLSR